MNRRDWLGVFGSVVAGPVVWGRSADDLLALGRELHRRADGAARRILDPRQSELVATIAELIIPATDTPGARAARVPEFIDLLLAEWAGADERTRFLAGLADVDARARAEFGTDFLGATETQRAGLLTRLDAESGAAPAARGDGPPPFFQSMKWLTLYGYCTSDAGARGVLRYEAVPGSYDACVALGRWRAAPGDF